MKTFKQKIVFLPFVLFSLLLLSWDYLAPTEEGDGPENRARSSQSTDFQESQTAGLDFQSASGRGTIVPAAEDVMVKKIPGDANHLLIMAYYPKTKYSGPAFNLDAGNALLSFSDDGKNYDEKAGDGIYTARIPANIKAFRNEAVQMMQQMKLSGQKAYRFEHRAMLVERNLPDFKAERLDKFNAVSIAGLTTPTSNKLIDSLRKNSIFITDLRVVEDPERTWNPCTQTGNLNGAWSFKTLFQQLASPSPDKIATDQQLSDFVKNWLGSFAKNRIINGDTVLARKKVQQLLINPWLDKSQKAGNPSGFLDMRFAPFKLTSILNRFDLRERFSGIPAGEARFTFCLINNDCTQSLPFTFVVEYGVPKQDFCDQLQDWAIQWFNLKNLDLGSAAYNQALQNITDQFTKSGQSANKANQNCLNTVRTNDRAFSPLPVISEFREFRLNKKNHQLVPSTVAQIPADKYNAQVSNPDVELLVKYINERRDSISNDTYWIPNTYDGEFFLAGAAHILGNPLGDARTMPVYHWNGTSQRQTTTFIRNTMTRHVFSLNTCTGCHSGELQTNFFHVEPVFFGSEAGLSGFLTGRPQTGAFDADLDSENDSMMVVDASLRPEESPMIRMFNDILRRAKDLKQIATGSCGDVFQVRDMLMHERTSAVH